MANMLDYLATEFRTFEELPFNAVDALVLSEFCMVRMEAVLPLFDAQEKPKRLSRVRAALPRGRGACFKDALAAEYYADMFVGLVPEKVKALMVAVAASPRFRAMRLVGCASVFDEERSTQFAALSFTYKGKFSFVGFRGTDCSFAGWREDFDMAYMERIPSQDHAVRYLDALAPQLPGKIFVGGHSKGGNLAVYAATCCAPKVRARVDQVFALDSPGFREGMLPAAEAQAVAARTQRIVPQESLIGTLMRNPAPYRVVESDGSGLWQHDPFTWHIENGEFVWRDGLTQAAQFTDGVLDEWLEDYSPDQARMAVDALFDAMRASGAKDFAEMLEFGPKTFSLMREAAKNTPVEARATLTDAIGRLMEVAAKRALKPGAKGGPSGK